VVGGQHSTSLTRVSASLRFCYSLAASVMNSDQRKPDVFGQAMLGSFKNLHHANLDHRD